MFLEGERQLMEGTARSPQGQEWHRALGGVGKKMLVQGPLGKAPRRWCGLRPGRWVCSGDKPGSGGVHPVPPAAAVGFGGGLPHLVRPLPVSSQDVSAE